MAKRLCVLLASAASAAAFSQAPSPMTIGSGPVARVGRCSLQLRAQAEGVSGRRIFLKQAAAAIPALAVPSLAGADSTGKFSSKRTAKNRYVPRIKKGIAAFEQLESGGDGAAFQATLDDMTSAMKLYGQANRRGELPDKISNRLEADADAFAKAAKSGDKAATRTALDKYFEDLPKDGKEPFGTGKVE
eukprot:Tamp_31697.p1 GENE.Tamp_31697~~Tamp_31697.p1  ORF type:complete len:189 (+),score=41.67 Tamp_31697:31-597(+)